MRTTNSSGLIRLLLIAAIATATVACRDYKQLPQTPKVDATHFLRTDAATGSDTVSVASIPWRTYFPDAHLQALISEGITNNYSMKVALKRIEQAEANLTMARNANLPTVAAAARIDHTRLSTGKNGTDVFGYVSNINSLGLSVSWEADLWGKLSSQAKARYATYLNSQENVKLIQTTLIANIARNYYSLEALDEQLRTTNENIALLQKTVETMQALKDAGQTTQAAVEQSNALLYSTQISVFALQSQIRQTENAICVLVGRPAGSVERGNISDQQLPVTMNSTIPVRSLANRPDVKQAELALQTAYATTDAARAAFYPTLSLSSLTLGFASGDFANFFSPAHLATEIVASVTQPIWARGQLKSSLKIARSQQEEALLTFSNTMLTAGQEVSDILYTYQSSVKKNDWRVKQIESLTHAVDYTQELLKAGEATYTEVLTAQQNLLTAQLGKITDKLEQLTQSVNLYRALGGGIQ